MNIKEAEARKEERILARKWAAVGEMTKQDFDGDALQC